jgi:hypothetical protein
MEAINERKVESKIMDIGHYAFHLYIVPLFLLPKSSKMHAFGVIILLFVHASSFFSKKKSEESYVLKFFNAKVANAKLREENKEEL